MPSLFDPFGLFDPGGTFGPPSGGPQGIAPGQSTGSVTGRITQWNNADIENAYQRVREARWAGMISENDHNRIVNEITARRLDPFSVNDMIDNAIQSQRSSTALASAEESRRSAVELGRRGLDEYEKFTRPVLQGEVDRFDRIFGNSSRGIAPGGLRSDAEFAQFLAEQQGAVNAEVNATRKAASIGNAARGVASSGKVGDQVMKAGILGGEARGRIEQGAYNIARQGRDSANDRFSGFLSDLGTRRAAVELGNIDASVGLSGTGNPFMGQSFNYGPATAVDLNALNLGNDRANLALITQALLGAGGMANQTLGQVTGMFGK